MPSKAPIACACGIEMINILVFIVFALAVILGVAAIFLLTKDPHKALKEETREHYKHMMDMERISPNRKMYNRMKSDGKH